MFNHMPFISSVELDRLRTKYGPDFSASYYTSEDGGRWEEANWLKDMRSLLLEISRLRDWKRSLDGQHGLLTREAAPADL